MKFGPAKLKEYLMGKMVLKYICLCLLINSGPEKYKHIN